MESMTALDSAEATSAVRGEAGRDVDIAVIGAGMGGIAVAYTCVAGVRMRVETAQT